MGICNLTTLIDFNGVQIVFKSCSLCNCFEHVQNFAQRVILGLGLHMFSAEHEPWAFYENAHKNRISANQRREH
jgi:hypothetical protein